ncbi:MAG: alpha/beta fold hydrolase [Deltaproteobacteria bacterium]|nr:alpha/beta fold hydrolase [Deltaproteobacteria bacterium]
MEQLKVQSVAGFISQVAACCTFDGRSYLEKISAPTLVLGAKDDQLVTSKELEELAAGIPQAKTVLFESVGHLGFSLEYQRFNREVLSFIMGMAGFFT